MAARAGQPARSGDIPATAEPAGPRPARAPARQRPPADAPTARPRLQPARSNPRPLTIALLVAAVTGIAVVITWLAL